MIAIAPVANPTAVGLACLDYVPEGERRLGDVLKIEGSLAEGASVLWTFPFPSNSGYVSPENLRLHFYNATPGCCEAVPPTCWQPVPIAEVTAAGVIADVSHFSYWMVTSVAPEKAVAYYDNYSVSELAQAGAARAVAVDVLITGADFSQMVDEESHVTAHVTGGSDIEGQFSRTPEGNIRFVGQTKATGELRLDEIMIQVTRSTNPVDSRDYWIRGIGRRADHLNKLVASAEISWSQLEDFWPSEDPAYVAAKDIFTYDHEFHSDMELQYVNMVTPAGIDGRVDMPDGGVPQTYFFVKDHLGSTRMMLDQAGNVAEATAYLAYGEVKTLKDASDQPVREKFTGKELDQEGTVTYAAIDFDLTVSGFSPYAPPRFLRVTLQFGDGSSRTEHFTYDGATGECVLRKKVDFDGAKTIAEIYLESNTDCSPRVADGFGFDGTTGCLSQSVTPGNCLKITFNQPADGLYGPPSCEHPEWWAFETSSDEGELFGIGLFYFPARYYDPEIGMFISTDAAGEFHNSYRYTVNPISHVDPDGLLDYETTVADKSINVHIDDSYGESTVNAYKAKIDAGIDIINSSTVEKESFLALRNINGISVEKRMLFGFIPLGDVGSGMNRNGVFNIGAGTLNDPNATNPWMASIILHDAGHYWQLMTGGNYRDERNALRLQLRNAKAFGLEQYQVDQLNKDYANPQYQNVQKRNW